MTYREFAPPPALASHAACLWWRADAPAARIADVAAVDPLVRAAVLELSRPRTRVGALSKRLAISERQLRRRFEGAVGYSPRTLTRDCAELAGLPAAALLAIGAGPAGERLSSA